jgi:putative transcriptional regulator
MAKQGYKNRIRVVLADRQVTNRALADMMGVSEMTISRWVTNRFQPSMSQFVEISKLMNVDIKELIEVDPYEISGMVAEPNPTGYRIAADQATPIEANENKRY